jgi:hypothetical protein
MLTRKGGRCEYLPGSYAAGTCNRQRLQTSTYRCQKIRECKEKDDASISWMTACNRNRNSVRKLNYDSRYANLPQLESKAAMIGSLLCALQLELEDDSEDMAYCCVHCLDLQNINFNGYGWTFNLGDLNDIIVMPQKSRNCVRLGYWHYYCVSTASNLGPPSCFPSLRIIRVPEIPTIADQAFDSTACCGQWTTLYYVAGQSNASSGWAHSGMRIHLHHWSYQRFLSQK